MFVEERIFRASRVAPLVTGMLGLVVVLISGAILAMAWSLGIRFVLNPPFLLLLVVVIGLVMGPAILVRALYDLWKPVDLTLGLEELRLVRGMKCIVCIPYHNVAGISYAKGMLWLALANPADPDTVLDELSRVTSWVGPIAVHESIPPGDVLDDLPRLNFWVGLPLSHSELGGLSRYQAKPGEIVDTLQACLRNYWRDRGVRYPFNGPSFPGN